MEFNTDNLQVGDKVIVVYRDNFSGCRKYVGTVTKKTPSGLVDVLCCGYTVRYRRDGSENCKRERYVMRDRYLLVTGWGWELITYFSFMRIVISVVKSLTSGRSQMR